MGSGTLARQAGCLAGVVLTLSAAGCASADVSECSGFAVEIDSSSGGETSAAEALAAWLEQSHPYYTGDVPIDGWALTADGTDAQEFTNGNSTLHAVRLEVSAFPPS